MRFQFREDAMSLPNKTPAEIFEDCRGMYLGEEKTFVLWNNGQEVTPEDSGALHQRLVEEGVVLMRFDPKTCYYTVRKLW